MALNPINIDAGTIPYPDIQHGDIMYDYIFDNNNSSLLNKINELITAINNIKNTLSSNTDGDSAADNIPITEIIGFTANTVQEAIEELKSSLAGVVLGEIPDGTLTTAKLSFNPLYEQGGVTQAAWLYTYFKNALTPEELAIIEANVPLMAIINANPLPLKWYGKCVQTSGRNVMGNSGVPSQYVVLTKKIDDLNAIREESNITKLYVPDGAKKIKVSIFAKKIYATFGGAGRFEVHKNGVLVYAFESGLLDQGSYSSYVYNDFCKLDVNDGDYIQLYVVVSQSAANEYYTASFNMEVVE